MDEFDVGKKRRMGIRVIAVLGLLTALEFWVAVTVTTGLLGILSIIVLVKAALIVEYFMHYSQLWHRERDL